MKYFPFKTIIFCILVVPLLFNGTLISLEKYLSILYQDRVQNNILLEMQNNIFLENSNILDRNNYDVNSIVLKVIKNSFQNDKLIETFGLNPYVKITDKQGNVIFSSCFNITYDNNISRSFFKSWISGVYKTEPEKNNREIVKSDININVVVPIKHNTLLPNLIFGIYLFISLVIFGVFYKKALDKIKKADSKRVNTISNLVKYEQEYIDKLEILKKERELLAGKLSQAKKDYQEESRRASITEEELFDEIVELEKKLEENIVLQKEKEQEIDNLKNQLEKVERRKGSSKKRKAADSVEKRFAALYKNIDMNRKAVEGFLELDDDMQLKAEEIVHLLNNDPSDVTVKRKVFTGKKNKTASFEVLFAYNGRLYFRNIEGNKIEILVIGTKNTQDKDMEFLHYI